MNPFKFVLPGFIILAVALTLHFYPVFGSVAEDEGCLDCHGDRDFTGEKNGKTYSLYVNKKAFEGSAHADGGCTMCHMDADPEDIPHAEDLERVDCSMCHDEIAQKYRKSLHGKALQKGRYLAPTCITCHGKHNIMHATEHKSPTHKLNVPGLCGKCHKEGTPVSKLRSVDADHILENYSQSIHGDGLFKRGLVVTAVCTNCHTSHDILPHEDPQSSINRNNIAETCMQCHQLIEEVHQKVIKGVLWERKPHVLPVCVDCHQPHKIRRVFYESSFPDQLCMKCHSKDNIHKTVDGQKVDLKVRSEDIIESAHNGFTCVRCHVNMSNSNSPVCLNSGRVDCSMCHTDQVQQYQRSSHGKQHLLGDEEAPYCTDCHGQHSIKSDRVSDSPTFSRNVPELCSKCHSEGKKSVIMFKGEEHKVVVDYSHSIHGKGLIESGLLVSANCADCHTAHLELPSSDPLSSVNRNNIDETCAKCHLGIYEQFASSIHSPEMHSDKEKKLPVCSDCHYAHSIDRVDFTEFRDKIILQCGNCHHEVANSYFDTFHGKSSKLGLVEAAKCHDCHGAHNILPPENPKSMLSRQNIIETCKTCHPNSNKKFVGYLTHATHHDKDKYPFLYYTFWFMTILLISTFTFFGIHTILWIPKAISEKKKLRKMHAEKLRKKDSEASDDTPDGAN